MGGDKKRDHYCNGHLLLIPMLYYNEWIVCFVSMDTSSTPSRLISYLNIYLYVYKWKHQNHFFPLNIPADVHLRWGKSTLRENGISKEYNLSVIFWIHTLKIFEGVLIVSYLEIFKYAYLRTEKVHKN